MNKLIKEIAAHIQKFYFRKGGFKAFCIKHEICHNSAKNVYYHDGKYQHLYPGAVKQITEAMAKDRRNNVK